MASIIASTDLVCYELTSRDFRSLVESNGVLGWKLLQQLVKFLRATRKEAHVLEKHSARCATSTISIRVNRPV
jgi:CRP-like cAMP-binding protein